MALRPSCLLCTWVAPTPCATPDISAAFGTRIDHNPASCTLCGLPGCHRCCCKTTNYWCKDQSLSHVCVLPEGRNRMHGALNTLVVAAAIRRHENQDVADFPTLPHQSVTLRR